MRKHPSGRLVLAAALALASAASRSTQAADEPRAAVEAFDHLVVAVADLDRGIAWFEERTGQRASIGGSHPGRGTRNALLSLGAGHYLEIIAPDPAQPESKQGDAAEMAKLERPLLGGWAVRSADLAGELAAIRERGLEMQGPFPGSRERPDGRKLTWQTAFVAGPMADALPFLIEWGAGSPHPSGDAPPLGRLESLVVVHPEPEKATAALSRLGLVCPVVAGERFELRARISTPRGPLDL